MRGRAHSREFKLTIVRQLASGEKRPAQVCREHTLAKSLVARWRKEYETRGEAAFAPTEPTSTQAQTRLKLAQVLLADAAEIIAAREKAQIIHHTKDIDASGDEVEQAVRRVLRRKLPMKYYVGHGHMVDANLATSPQLDIIIADNISAPTLFQTESGAEYFPFESVYAIGEIKSAYYKSKDKSKDYLNKFVGTLAKIRTQLTREQTPPSHPGVPSHMPFGNPLFSFMIFVKSNDFFTDAEFNVVEKEIIDFYKITPPSDLPNLLCFIDKGVMMYSNIKTPGEKRPFFVKHPFSHFMSESEEEKYGWVFTSFIDEDPFGANLGMFCFLLLLHLKACVLTPPDLLVYLNNIFTIPQFTSLISG